MVKNKKRAVRVGKKENGVPTQCFFMWMWREGNRKIETEWHGETERKSDKKSNKQIEIKRKEWERLKERERGEREGRESGEREGVVNKERERDQE
jgi:hypothetical protein